MPVIVMNKVKEIAGEFSVSGDFYEALDKEVEALIKKATERAKANNRKTVMAKDL